ncbi:hypothetical protein ACRAQ7_11025 [Erythrobacter sp. W53]|uniref:Cap15 family cyclic dinucleotide receptor domain-containing protein n=1 Tax=Erythrobacter sp. W53 TaxID=3425947 RepID=UPI003D767A72
MSADHEYAIVNGPNRSSIGRWIYLGASVLSAILVLILLSLIDLAEATGLNANIPPTVFAVVSAGAVYGAIYFFFVKYIWKWSVVQKLLNVPNLSGRWDCFAVSSYKTDEYPDGLEWQATVDISQTLDKISVILRAVRSGSESVSAAVIPLGNGEYKLLYNYKNDPTQFEEGLNAHHGFVELLISNDLKSANGMYFTGRGRVTHGTMTWERNE